MGADPIGGTVQVVQTDPIKVQSIGKDGKAHVEMRSCGQFILMSPAMYRAIRDRLLDSKLNTAPVGDIQD